MRVLLFLTLAAAACGGKKPEPAAAEKAPEPTPPKVVEATAPPAPPTPPPPAPVEPPKKEVPNPYGADIKSLKVTKSTPVLLSPKSEAEPIGAIEAGTLVAWKGFSDAPGCKKGWVEIEPEGWLCSRFLEPAKKEPFGVVYPRLKPGKIVPGIYGRVGGEETIVYASEEDVKAGNGETLEGSLTVRLRGTVQIDGKYYWRTNKGMLIERQSIARFRPTEFQGIALDVEGAPTLPFAWAVEGSRSNKKIKVYDGERGRVLRQIEPRTILQVLEEKREWVRVGEGEWVKDEDLRIARVSEPPPLLSENERWVDVNTSSQVLVAFEGTRPVWATLVSSGKTKHPTPLGIYRVELKYPEDDMVNDADDEDVYSVERVPWATYFTSGFALHGAYWHDGFGMKMSHGCVNLSPKDAKFMYEWTEPHVPPGWTSARGFPEHPGTLVRIHQHLLGQPKVEGYARKLMPEKTASTP